MLGIGPGRTGSAKSRTVNTSKGFLTRIILGNLSAERVSLIGTKSVFGPEEARKKNNLNQGKSSDVSEINSSTEMTLKGN